MDCARNIITAAFPAGKTETTTAPLWQWDYGQVLCITGIDLPAAFEVHFSTNRMGGVSTVAVGADGQVTIPNDLLTIGKNLNAWIYLSDAQGEGETEYSITIPVKPRPMPETYDAEVTGEFDDVVRQVSEYAETAQTAADNAGASASATAASADSAAASASAAETAKTAAQTAQGKAEDAQAAAETAAQTATEKAQQTAQDAAQAAQSKADAESAAGRAEAAQTGAESAKTGAETAAQGAAASASAASASATSAGQAAISAGQSATAAAGSATTAQGAAQTATTKAGEASASATAANTAKTAAQTAQTGAETAATNAGQSASTATTKAAEAAQSASSAAQSKTDAEAAATRAEQAAATLTVDSALSDTSTNPVQNKVITSEITDVKSAIDALKIVDTASGAIASFPDGAAMPVESLTVEMSPIQEGTGDPSPDNIRPIAGRESVTVTRTGKNLADDEQFSIEKPSFTTDTYWLGLTKNADGTFTLTRPIGWGGYGKVFLGTFSAGTYTVSFETVDTAGVACTAALAVKKTGTWENSVAVGATDAPIGRTAFSPFTVSELSDIWISVGPFNNNGAQVISGDYQVELGSTATDYEPYKGQSVTIQLGQTVYGGNAEIISGQGESTMAMVDLGTLNWAYSTDYSVFVSESIKNDIADRSVICTMYPRNPADASNSAVLNSGDKWVTVNKGANISGAFTVGSVFVKDLSYTDAATFKAAMSGVMLCYKRATPQTIETTPTEMTTLKGQNNVWSDGDSVDVTYIADPKLYIARLTEPDADMVADANITSRSYFMVGNTLYLATANIASGANIVPGVNCTKTNLAAALNAINA